MSSSAVSDSHQYTAVILTALDVEYLAVREHLTDLTEEKDRGTRYEVGRFSGQLTWRVIIAEVSPGNNSAAGEAERALARYQPQIAMFVGVAGGVKDVVIGDVVAATKVYGYEAGKDIKTFLPRPNLGQSSFTLEHIAKKVRRESKWLDRIKSGSKMNRAFVSPIAAGEKVVASTRSATYKFLKANYGDAVAVEMEGRGFLTAVGMNEAVKGIVVRGISDMLDKKSAADQAGSQPLGSR